MKYIKRIFIVCGLCALSATIFGFSFKTSWLNQQACRTSWLDKLQEGDTLRINYSVASGELGSVHEGIFIFKDQGKFKVNHVIFNYGIEYVANGLIKTKPESNLIPLSQDSIKVFLYSIKNDFKVKKESILNESQICYLKEFFDEAENYEAHGFSNAAEYYFVDGSQRELVIVDRSGKWKKHRELKKKLSLCEKASE